eukprot:4820471-Alexandrium_andersonii.AAC.1
MLDQVEPATAEFYYTVAKEYHHRYGPEIWALLYQADVRCRLEHMERIRIHAIADFDAARTAGLAHAYSPAKPWEHCFRCAAEDAAFWKREVEEPALL